VVEAVERDVVLKGTVVIIRDRVSLEEEDLTARTRRSCKLEVRERIRSRANRLILSQSSVHTPKSAATTTTKHIGKTSVRKSFPHKILGMMSLCGDGAATTTGGEQYSLYIQGFRVPLNGVDPASPGTADGVSCGCRHWGSGLRLKDLVNPPFVGDKCT
jgi:hypothetical protein